MLKFPLVDCKSVRKWTLETDWIKSKETIDSCFLTKNNKANFFVIQWRIFFKVHLLGGHFRPLFLYFRLFNIQLAVNKCSIYIYNIIFCRWLCSNCGPLVSEASTLPTEPQPQSPSVFIVFYSKVQIICTLHRIAQNLLQRQKPCNSLITLGFSSRSLCTYCNASNKFYYLDSLLVKWVQDFCHKFIHITRPIYCPLVFRSSL